MNDLRVTLIQTSLFWENANQNFAHFDEKINMIAPATDLIVLPEMFTTGFSMNAAALADTTEGKTLNWMRQKAKEKQCVITGSAIIKDGSKYYNRLLWVNADGTYQVYDKKHLFRMGEEQQHYSAGNKKIICTVKGWKICPLICYDLRFPVWSRNKLIGQEAKYDVLLYVANWPERRAHAWKSLLVARAIENQTYVIGVNRVGEDGNKIMYSGDSIAIDMLGVPIGSIKSSQEQIETLSLNYQALQDYRKIFPALLDADSFEIIT